MEAVPYYPRLLRKRDIGELHPPASANVRFDSFGHGLVCTIDRFSKWKNLVLAQRSLERNRTSELRSGLARAWLDINLSADPLVSDALGGECFFWGDHTVPTRIAALYRS